ncbi:hypothetical protein FHL15_009000 [Xylaria flabelliformis]|uniref:Cytochrome b561 domain-containing protein n=1 Tax=Xylaria flabelliformis TaxID=2512241 RepID=A0A553HQ47_9PEZI|nr:hypothetical protein FHL15_009000 [Xylaria flabelliformis]
MRTTTLVSRAALLFGLVALAVTHANAQGPTFTGLNGWTAGNNNNPFNTDPNSDNNDDNNDNNNSTGSGDDNGSGNDNSSLNGSGSGSSSGNGNGSGSGGGYGNNNNNGGGYGGGFEGGFGNNGGSTSPFGPEINGLNNGLEYASLATYRVAHGVLASLAFAFLFPLGAILLRYIPGKAAVSTHWIIQVIASALYLIAAGLGLYLLSMIRIPSGAGLLDIMRGNAHPIIGIVLLIALFFQPVFGILHHRQFKKLQKRTWVSYVHLWLGRLSITLGIINGGLGLALADATGAPVAAYAVISSVMWFFWVLTIIKTSIRDFNARKGHKDSEIAAKIYDEDHEYPARTRNEGAGAVVAPRENAGVRGNASAGPYPAAVPMPEQDIPSPPYEPGPYYEEHMAHANHRRQRDFGRDEMQGIKEVIDSDSVSIITASQDEMRRGQV